MRRAVVMIKAHKKKPQLAMFPALCGGDRRAPLVRSPWCAQADRAALQAQLRDAELTAQARRDAERRVADLESAIAAARSRANKLTRTLTQQR